MSNGVQSCNGGLQLSNDVKENDNRDVELLEDFDSYWQYINDLVVSDIVIKSMVQQAAEKIADKELQVTKLKEMLHVYHVGVENEFLASLATHQVSNRLVKQGTKDKMHPSSLEAILEHDRIENGKHDGSEVNMSRDELINHYNAAMTKLKINHESKVQDMTEQLFSLKRESFKEWAKKNKEFDMFRRRISEVISKLDMDEENEQFETFQCSLKDRLESLPSENHQLRDSLTDKKREIKCLQVSEAAATLEKEKERFELAAQELENLRGETCRKQKMISRRVEVSKAAHRNLVKRHKAKICKLDQKLELARKELEEVNKERRMLVVVDQEKQNAVSLFETKERELKQQLAVYSCGLLKAITDFVRRVTQDISGKSPRLESLVSENHQLKDLLIDKKREIKCLSLQVSEAAEKMSEHNGESSSQCEIEHLNMESIIMQELEVVIFREAWKDAEQKLNNMNMIYTNENELRVSLELENLEKGKQLEVEVANKEKLKQEILFLAKEKERLGQDAAAALEKEKERYGLAAQEFENLRGETFRKQKMIQEVIEVANAAHHNLVERHKAEICKLHQKLELARKELEEVNEERRMLLVENQEKQNAVSLFETKEREFKQQLAVYSCGLLNAMTDFECRVTQDISGKSSRLKSLSSQTHSLKQKANVLVRRGFQYKQGFERKCSDLVKAEAEVDLLGEEVDTLSSLVEKIYIALDHYSPILQHDAGITEILKLIRRKLRVETKAV